MTDSCILEKAFRTLTGLKFETLFLSLDYLSIRETDVNTVIYSIHEWLRKHFSRHFHQFRINFISSCSLFGVYIFKKPINFRSGYTIKLKLCVSLWIVKILFYFWYARVITIMLHYVINDYVSSNEFVSETKLQGFCPEDYSTTFRFLQQ